MSRRLLWFLVLGTALSLTVLIAGSDADPIAHLLRRDFDTLLLAHGAPVANRGKAALRRLVEEPTEHAGFGPYA